MKPASFAEAWNTRSTLADWEARAPARDAWLASLLRAKHARERRAGMTGEPTLWIGNDLIG